MHPQIAHDSKPLDMLSRLKGIETNGPPFLSICLISLDMLSRLKGMENTMRVRTLLLS